MFEVNDFGRTFAIKLNAKKTGEMNQTSAFIWDSLIPLSV